MVPIDEDCPGQSGNHGSSSPLLYGGFGIDGTWKYDSGINQWTKIATGNPETMAAAGSALYGGFGIDGTWKYDSDINQWTKLAPGDPETMTAAGSLLYGGFEIDGTWKYDSDINQWTKIAPGNPEVMTAAGSLLYGDFGARRYLAMGRYHVDPDHRIQSRGHDRCRLTPLWGFRPGRRRLFGHLAMGRYHADVDTDYPGRSGRICTWFAPVWGLRDIGCLGAKR